MKSLFGLFGTVLRAIFPVFGILFSRLPICSLAGIIVGSFTGFIMTLFQLQYPLLPLSLKDLLLATFMIGSTGFLLILLFMGLLLQYGVSRIFWSALVNSLITAAITVYVTYYLKIPVISAVLGLLIGIMVGAILCWLCRLKDNKIYGKT